ncbi:hypothetical protein VTJ04DRAFT_5565 [Mycothermus thermophilus]|uniref:uncharacterized protein n=1 Tax=Humicola insolens TaxID=85995 RepID=UPI003743B86A
MPAAPLRVSFAVDILADPTRASLPRYAAYRRARARFWEAFPDGVRNSSTTTNSETNPSTEAAAEAAGGGEVGKGGAYVRLPTSGAALECGLHALALSLRHQLPSQPAAVKYGLQPPTVQELRDVVRQMNQEAAAAAAAAASIDLGRGVVGVGAGNWNWFGADEMVTVFCAWGKQACSRIQVGEGEEEPPKLRFQLGWVTDPDPEVGDEGWPVMMNTPEVETGEVGEDIVRVWIWNDGASYRGGVGHFEGIRRPTEEELKAVIGRK